MFSFAWMRTDYSGLFVWGGLPFPQNKIFTLDIYGSHFSGSGRRAVVLVCDESATGERTQRRGGFVSGTRQVLRPSEAMLRVGSPDTSYANSNRSCLAVP